MASFSLDVSDGQANLSLVVHPKRRHKGNDDVRKIGLVQLHTRLASSQKKLLPLDISLQLLQLLSSSPSVENFFH